MKRRRITLADGRYLIFYTFDDEYPARRSAEQAGAQQHRHEPERPVEAGEREEKPHV
jgi:hypothetical protein